MTGARLSAARRRAIADRLAAGESYASIARNVGCSKSTVGAIAKADGLRRDNSQTWAATETRQATAAEKRATLMNDLLDDAARLRQQLWTPCRLHNFGGKDNSYNFIDLDQPTFQQQLDIMRAVSTAAQRALDIARYADETASSSQSVALIERLAAGLTGLAGGADEPGPGEGVT